MKLAQEKHTKAKSAEEKPAKAKPAAEKHAKDKFCFDTAVLGVAEPAWPFGETAEEDLLAKGLPTEAELGKLMISQGITGTDLVFLLEAFLAVTH